MRATSPPDMKDTIESSISFLYILSSLNCFIIYYLHIASSDKASRPVAPHPLIKTLFPSSNVSVIALNISKSSGILLMRILMVIISNVLIILMAFLTSFFAYLESPTVCGEGYSVGSLPSLNI